MNPAKRAFLKRVPIALSAPIVLGAFAAPEIQTVPGEQVIVLIDHNRIVLLTKDANGKPVSAANFDEEHARQLAAAILTMADRLHKGF